jgi:DNA-binding CsgD family transcriptional regulator
MSGDVSRFAAEWPLVGRDRELAFAATALADEDTSGIALTGPAGVGRTRLAREMLARAAEAGWETEWLVATQAAASVPFGATAALLPLGERMDGVQSWQYLRVIVQHLAERAAGRPLVVGIDDAHLLDDASAALVHQLALQRLVFVVVTVQEGAPAPDAIAALWKDEYVRCLSVEPLGSPAIDELVRHALGPEVDGATRAELLGLSGGNPRALRRLLTESASDGRLVQRAGVWCRTTTLLTPRECEVSALAASGMPSKVIAAHLSLSLRTVNNHLARAYNKLGVSKRAELRALFFPNGHPHEFHRA